MLRCLGGAGFAKIWVMLFEFRVDDLVYLEEFVCLNLATV